RIHAALSVQAVATRPVWTSIYTEPRKDTVDATVTVSKRVLYGGEPWRMNAGTTWMERRDARMAIGNGAGNGGAGRDDG
ncbi:hypothetical protein ACTGY2_10945, partial [Streptococcus suis]